MESLRWQRVQDLFHSLADLPPSQQRASLEKEESALAAEVQALLDADASGSSSPIDGSVAEVAAGIIGGEDPIARAGLDAYRVERVLGEGGMGIVYLAHRKDFGRQVALKLLRDASLSPSRRERFAAEQRMLAQLDHPSIARLYDSGITPDGTPYFEMEYVDGEPLCEWCRKRATDLPQRLGLFRALCEAVNFAHSHAVVHRDLKPSNVLVKSDGALRLLDFGIAKQLEPDADSVTQTQFRMLTPAYAAPEQFRGGRTGVRTDVYSLGVVLYELIADAPPFDLSGCTPAEAERRIHEVTPSLPSARAKHRWPSLAWSDLDVLALKAMHRDPERRYASVEALLRDVDHFLHGEPLEARPDSFAYRLSKFIARNRSRVLAGTATSIALLVAVVFFTVRLARARDAALAEAARAQHVQAFLQDLLEGGDREAGPAAELKVVTLLERGAKEADTLAAEPAMQADLFATLGVMYFRLGHLDRAGPLLERALERHRALRGPQDATVVADLASLARIRLDEARNADADRLAREAVALAHSALPAGHPGISDALASLGAVLADENELDAAAKALDEAVALRSRPGVSPLDLAGALAQLADIRFAAGRYDEATALNERTIALYRAQLGPRHPRVAERIFTAAGIRGFSGNGLDANVDNAKDAVAMLREWYGPDNPRVAGASSDVGVGLAGLRRYDEAEPLLREAYAIRERSYGKSHPTVADTAHALAGVCSALGRHDEAKIFALQSRDIFRAAYGEHHPLYAGGLLAYAKVLLGAGQPAQAEAPARGAYAIFSASRPADHRDVAISRERLGLTLLRQQRYTEAEPILLAALASYEKFTGYQHTLHVGETLEHLVDLYTGVAQPEKAMPYRAELDRIRASGAPAYALPALPGQPHY
jgi:serine/threonine protein kinase/tetratricopeptide (TPR) repeat protein